MVYGIRILHYKLIKLLYRQGLLQTVYRFIQRTKFSFLATLKSFGLGI